MTKFVEIHAIHSVPPSNLNRDDTGSPKSALVGGVKRHRVSSQSWKKAIRDYFGENNPVESLGVRTKNIGSLIVNKLVELDPEMGRNEAIDLAVKAMVDLKIIGSKKAKEKDANEEGLLQSDALFLISIAQVEALAKILVRDKQDAKPIDLKRVLKENNSLDLALFGRMVASDPDLNVDASAQFAHAFSTHETSSEFDFFTAVDDHSEEEHAGAGMMGDVEFTSSTLYRYAVVNVDALSSQFENSEEAVAEGIHRFLTAFLRSIPSGKQNSFAALTLPEAFIVKVTENQPISYANAFERPVRGGSEGYSLSSVKTLVKAIDNTNQAYGSEGDKVYATGLSSEIRDELSTVATLGTLSETLQNINAELVQGE